MSQRMTKQTKWSERPAKIQISLGIHPIWSETSPCATWVAKNQRILHADSKDFEQTGRIWVFAGCTCHFSRFCRAAALVFISVSLIYSVKFGELNQIMLD